ncbi:MAG: biotin/lipoyl-containing protein, partial [Bacteroidia bacterium]
MAQHDLIMPKMGESVAEATIIKWVKNEGDKIKIDETVLEIATDKVDSEIPSSFEGILVKKLFKEGDVVQVGTVIAHISSDVNATAGAPQAPVAAAVSSSNTSTPAPVKEVAHTTNQDFSQSNKFFSPLVKSIAKEEGISVQELEKI